MFRAHCNRPPLLGSPRASLTLRITGRLQILQLQQKWISKNSRAPTPENDESMKGVFWGIGGGTNKETIVDFVRAKFEYVFPRANRSVFIFGAPRRLHRPAFLGLFPTKLLIFNNFKFT
ncbi:hypothetical protein [Chitinolyticbacter albus]|uniref:hypothetical protein n=1 Tax=Chitinolyticbacter albus TaxID=2961951 RepID=UPI002108A2CB|nr:hypothetical protein [Chitinolyticbacter albus]